MNFFDVEVSADGLKHEQFTLPLNTDQQSLLNSYNGQSIQLGIRPEHLDLSEQAAKISATLNVSELMGNESYLYCSSGEDEFIARVADNQPRKLGSQVTVYADPINFHFFEQDSGIRI